MSHCLFGNAQTLTSQLWIDTPLGGLLVGYHFRSAILVKNKSPITHQQGFTCLVQNKSG